MAAKYDLNIDQGGAFRRVFTWKDDDNNPIDLTDYDAKAQLREVEGAATAALTASVGAGLALGGAAGTIDLRFTSAQTAALSELPYVWELVLTPPSGAADAFSFLKGQVNISGQVTA